MVIGRIRMKKCTIRLDFWLSSLVSSTTIEKSELRSDEDGVRISCFYGRIEKTIIHMPGESDYEILRALSFSHIRLSETVFLQ